MKQSGCFFFYWRDMSICNVLEALFWPFKSFFTAKAQISAKSGQFEYKYVVFTKIHGPWCFIAAKNAQLAIHTGTILPHMACINRCQAYVVRGHVLWSLITEFFCEFLNTLALLPGDKTSGFTWGMDCYCELKILEKVPTLWAVRRALWSLIRNIVICLIAHNRFVIVHKEYFEVCDRSEWIYDRS